MRFPPRPANVAGKKYQSDPGDWTTGTSQAGWQCLKFTMTDPQYYIYNYESAGGGTDGSSFKTLANGDLNGDGNFSTFSLSGKVQAGTKGLECNIAPNIDEKDATE